MGSDYSSYDMWAVLIDYFYGLVLKRFHNSVDFQLDDEVTTFNLDISSFDLGSICSVVKCGAHICQLAAKDISSLPHNLAELTKVRTFVKEAKKVEHGDLFKHAQLKLPQLDNEPRWDTKYLMCESVYLQKEGISKFTNSKLQITPELWSFLLIYTEAFRPIFVAMKEFQRREITFGS